MTDCVSCGEPDSTIEHRGSYKKDNNKYSSKIELKKIDDLILADYLIKNRSKFQEWFD